MIMQNERYVAVQDSDSELWGIESTDGAILYEADIASEAQAQFMAVYHTNNPDAEFERDVWPAWVEYLARNDPYESALLFVETAPQDELINLVIEYRKLKAEAEEMKALEDAAFGGHEDVWIDVDGHQQRVFGDPNMSEETKKRLAVVIKAASESVSNGDFDNDE